VASWDQIVIGRGTSALTFLHAAFHGTQSAKFVHNETLVIGPSAGQLWSKVGSYNPDHRMGQPEHLLRPSGLKPDPSLQSSHGQFIKTGDYNKMLGQLLDKTLRDRGGERPPLFAVDANVTEIHADGAWYRVVTDGAGEHAARQVIVAGGAGRGQNLSALGIPIEGNDKDAIASTGEYLDSVDYMTKAQSKGLKVLIYGGSASSSWAVTHAFAMQAKEVLWGCRRGLTQIETEGNPVGRNSATIEKAKSSNMICRCEIEKITVLDGNAFEHRLRVHFKPGSRPELPPTVDFDQIVYSVGADPVEALGPGGILKGDLPTRMVPVWDNNFRFSRPGEQAAITALKDGLGDLWVVGAAVFRGLGLASIKEKLIQGNTNFYAKVGDILCAGGRPPEGIAIVDATVNAVTGYRQTDAATFNWNKANRRDIFQMLAKIYQVEIPLSIRERLVDDIISRRAATNFGISQLQLEQLMTELKRKYRLNIDLARLPGVWDGS
jgi:hypothetical protein